jgi:hypothetical protein
MALTLITGLFSSVSGTFGGMVLTKNRAGTIARAKKRPTLKFNWRAAIGKATTANLAANWSYFLTPAQRLTWATLAATAPFRNANGTVLAPLLPIPPATVPPRTRSLYTSANMNRKLLRLTYLTDAPADMLTSDLLSLHLTAPGLSITTGATPPPSDYIVFTSTPTRPAGATAIRFKATRLTLAIPANTPQPFNLAPAWAAKFGVLIPKSLVQVTAYTIRPANGARGPAYSATLVIT